MSVKFRLAFDVEAETLFKLMSKLLPIDNLVVEELRPSAPKLMAQPKLMAHKVKAKRANNYPHGPGARGGADLTKGMNRIIVELFSDGKPHHASELTPLVVKQGFSPRGVSSRLQALKDLNVVHQPDHGLWAIGEKPKKTSAA